jgi:hypothetical protein
MQPHERPAGSMTPSSSRGTLEWLREELVRFIPEKRVLHHPIDLIAFASDASSYRPIPKAVVLASIADEIKELFRYSRKRKISLTFRTAGTSLSGQSITDGILVEVKRYWNSVKEAGLSDLPAPLRDHEPHRRSRHGQDLPREGAQASGGSAEATSSRRCRMASRSRSSLPITVGHG